MHKKISSLFICCLIISSCSHKIGDHPKLVDSDNTQGIKITPSDTNEIKINSSFPFGCAELTKFKYPMYWEGDPENYGHLKKTSGKEFDKIGQCFAAINAAQTIKSPTFQSLEIMPIGNNFRDAHPIDTLLQSSFTSCKYRLPNVSIYECYYSFERFGNLLLLNPKTNKGKLINIYTDDLAGDSHTILRYFFLTGNTVHIYEGSCYDDGCFLDEKYKISIDSKGTVNITPTKK